MVKYYFLLCLALLISVATASSTDQKKAIINLRQLQGATRPPKTPPPTAAATRPPKTQPPTHVATRPPKTPAPTEAVPETPSPTIAGPQSIAQIVCSNNDDFSTLGKYLRSTRLYDVLNSSGTSTLFAPNDAAFEKLANVVDLTDDEIMGLLMYHVAPNILTYNNLMMIAPGDVETMVPVLPISVSTGADGEVLLNGNVKIIISDMEASNGIIQVIDQVIIPPIGPPTPAPPTLMGKSSKHSSKSSKHSSKSSKYSSMSMSNMSYKV
mmetsp:Transcript_28711/g.43360  ORF Transcript_28711/g.43360 Transcript_28711/m.43360 type:complete len:267 (+) Transcript_28711:25-825(+)|eukprot:scaffold4536_cov164-Skeletonema_dohrnii-CCMP3373.AAC.4